jgi:hypothetical protein
VAYRLALEATNKSLCQHPVESNCITATLPKDVMRSVQPIVTTHWTGAGFKRPQPAESGHLRETACELGLKSLNYNHSFFQPIEDTVSEESPAKCDGRGFSKSPTRAPGRNGRRRGLGVQ